MRTIRFARHHRPKDETKSTESFLVLDCRLSVKAVLSCLAPLARVVAARSQLSEDYHVTGLSAMDCVVCGSAAVTERRDLTAQGYRRFRCRDCGKQFNERSDSVLNSQLTKSRMRDLFISERLGTRAVADVLKVRLHATRTKAGNFLRRQDRAGALNFSKSLEVCRMVRVGFRQP